MRIVAGTAGLVYRSVRVAQACDAATWQCINVLWLCSHQGLPPAMTLTKEALVRDGVCSLLFLLFISRYTRTS